MKILITGNRGKLYKTVLGAFSPRSSFQAVAVPLGSELLEMARTPSWEALIFVLRSEEEIEPVRWIRQQNGSLPLLAVLAREDVKLREELAEEGVSAVVLARDLTAEGIRRRLREHLQELRREKREPHRPARQFASALHAIRSALTAIQGNAELTLKNASAGRSKKKQLEAIIAGVAEIERILRHLERDLGTSGMLPAP